MYLYGTESRPAEFGGWLSGAPVAAAACNPALDATAKAILRDAQDPAFGKHSRAVTTVWNIVKTYYPADTGLVSSVIFLSTQGGLATTSVGSPPAIRGIISVGPDFIDHTTDRFFARRVLQVGHELQHIKQWNAGMRGPAFKNEREFRAHCWTAFTPEFPGTGCMQHATRVGIIDCALGHYHCMTAADQRKYATGKTRLLTLRGTEETASGRAATTPRSTCDTTGC
jgi:hypothetical protein